jgi:hypothetical protein
MSRCILALAAVLFAALAASACDYGQRSVCAAVQVQAAPVYQQAQVYQAVVPQYAQVVVPTVASFAQVQYAAPIVQKQVVVQKQFVQAVPVYGSVGYAQQSFSQRSFVGGGFGGRQRAFGGGGGGGFLANTIDAVGRLANSPAGSFIIGAGVANGRIFGRR